MESLAVKYRPQTLEEIVSQESVTKILARQVSEGKIKNCYLFTGASGCGKTTTARALARLINGNSNGVIEVDGASNNGVDNIRALITSASERAIGAEYKIIIMDECFTENTNIITSVGNKAIKDVQVGDLVLTLDGFKKVVKTFNKEIDSNRLVSVKLNNSKKVDVTDNHLFLTVNGWVKAKDLREGDVLIDNQSVSRLWQGISDTEHNLFDGMWTNTSVATEAQKVFSQKVHAYLCNLWKGVGNNTQKNTADLFNGMLFDTAYKKAEGAICLRTWDGTQEISIRKCEEVSDTDTRNEAKEFNPNEAVQSNGKQYINTKDATDEEYSWNTSLLDRTAWGEWTLYTPTVDFEREFGECLGVGISNSNGDNKGKQPKQISYLLQVRPCLSRKNDWDRGGWQNSLAERTTIQRLEEDKLFGTVRVESVEVYQRTDRHRIEEGIRNSTRVYDLAVEDCPTYFANGVCVHNCHMITVQGWNAFLKTLEEPPKYTIFMFCTTNPEKIPITVLNRLQRFNLQRIPANKIEERLNFICKQELFTNYKEACAYISKISNGQMRDAITALDKCASYDTDLSIDKVLFALGNFSYDMFFDLLNAIIDDNEGAVLQIINSIYYDGKDLNQFIISFTAFILDVTKYLIFGNFDVLQIPTSYQNALDNVIKIENVQLYYNYLIDMLYKLREAVKFDTDIKSTSEILFLKMARNIE